LEDRKGIALFCDALDLLAVRGERNVRVVFLGKESKVAGKHATQYIRERSGNWPFPYRVFSDLDHNEALRFLRDGDRLAIIPSLIDNLPNTVLECLCARIPFLASRAGGIPEMIAPQHLEEVTFTLSPYDLAERVIRALHQGICVARPAVDPEETRQRWIDWHSIVSTHTTKQQPRPFVGINDYEPSITVCITQRDQTKLLQETLESLEPQVGRPLEIIVVDRGSTTPHALERLEEMTSNGGASRLRLIHRDDPSEAAARNAAVAAATGDYILFTDVFSRTTSEEVRIFGQIAKNTNADILTCFLDFVDAERPMRERRSSRSVFLGPAIVPNIFHNCFGEKHFLVRRAVVREVGGFPEDLNGTGEDEEFFAQAILTGFRLEVVPRALVRRALSSKTFNAQSHETRLNDLRLRPYLAAMPITLRDAIPYAVAIRRLLSAANSSPNTHHNGLPWDPDQRLTLATELANSGDRTLAHLLKAWINFRTVRSNLSQGRRERLPDIARLLFNGQYHRFAHGLGSALRDARRAPKSDDR
jgi:glycosyltransferase involved in cell wall biosynthesis